MAFLSVAFDTDYHHYVSFEAEGSGYAHIVPVSLERNVSQR